MTDDEFAAMEKDWEEWHAGYDYIPCLSPAFERAFEAGLEYARKDAGSAVEVKGNAKTFR